MTKRAAEAAILLLAGTAFWQAVCAAAAVAEPWDAPAYWQLWYPFSLAASALAGWLARAPAWRAGAILTFAQLPVLAANGAAGPLWPAGLLLLGALALPAAAISALAGALRSRMRAR